MAQYQFPPMPKPVGIFDSFIARQTETLVLKEKVLSLSGDSFDIKLANGTPVFKVQGSVMSLSGRKSVYDMAGGHMFDIQKELLHIHATFACVTPQGQKIMEVKSKFSRKLTLVLKMNGGLISFFLVADCHCAEKSSGPRP
jgi:uncharacterized protein YxjI